MCAALLGKVVIVTCMTSQESEILELEKKWADTISRRRDAYEAANFLSESYFLAIGDQNMPLQIVPKERWLAALQTYVVSRGN